MVTYLNKIETSRTQTPERKYRVVYTFGRASAVDTELMNAFHGACRKFDKPSGSIDRGLLDYVGKRFRYHHQNKIFLLAGYARNLTLEFTHSQITKKHDMGLESELGLGVLLAPWAKNENYVVLLCQPTEKDIENNINIVRLPVALVIDVYPEENIVSCAASYQSPVVGEPPKEDTFSLKELQNAIVNVPMVTRFEPPREYYEKLYKKWHISIWG